MQATVYGVPEGNIRGIPFGFRGFQVGTARYGFKGQDLYRLEGFKNAGWYGCCHFGLCCMMCMESRAGEHLILALGQCCWQAKSTSDTKSFV